MREEQAIGHVTNRPGQSARQLHDASRQGLRPETFLSTGPMTPTRQLLWRALA